MDQLLMRLSVYSSGEPWIPNYPLVLMGGGGQAPLFLTVQGQGLSLQAVLICSRLHWEVWEVS